MEASSLYQLLFLLPLVTAGIIACFLRKKHNLAAGFSVISALVFSGIGLYLIYSGQRSSWSVPWLSLGDKFQFTFGVLFDDLAALMLLVLIIVGLLVQVFSLGYMKDDPGKARFFAGLSIFMFSMLGIVLADNLVMIFVFWELVGFSSYVLINHYFDKPSAVAASKKAFIVNRVGDFGFLLGIIFVYWQFGTFDLVELAELAGENAQLISTSMGLLLFCGVLGKSAQMPLHVWLPDAMEGPTPISALIHAATMVAAGIYFTARVYFLMTPDALYVVMWVGTITAAFAALVAFGQNDIKKLLAFSTLSQLGYMVAALGLGAKDSFHGPAGSTVIATGAAVAMFHLTTHAFFKSLLFLNSGSIIHACHHEQDIYKLGGLSGRMKLTFATFGIGVLAIGGFPFLAGFFSKDTILHLAHDSGYKAVYYILLATAALTGLYMGRLLVVTFFGKPRSENAEHARENGPAIVLPLIILAVLSVIGGYTWFFGHAFDSVIQALPHAEGSFKTLMIITGTAFSLGGIVIAWLVWNPNKDSDTLEAVAPGIFKALAARLYFDALYDWYVDKVQDRVALILSFLDQLFISGFMVRGTAGVIGLFGIISRSLHVGSLGGYVYWFAIGVVVLGAIAFGIL
ncbi:MAG: NADH-quinone oxidoreductase subunit L [Verrucomicrobia bacterium]|nr:NADH-quinone oxidoreductase subunit L [Verrucomicrobiota bacterium]